MRCRALLTAVALVMLLLGPGCCCCRPFHCLRPFRCRLHEKFGCGSCCCMPTVVEGSVALSPMAVGPGAPCDCGGDIVGPPAILRPTPAPGGVISPAPGGTITPMPPATSATPLPGPGPLTRSN